MMDLDKIKRLQAQANKDTNELDSTFAALSISIDLFLSSDVIKSSTEDFIKKYIKECIITLNVVECFGTNAGKERITYYRSELASLL